MKDVLREIDRASSSAEPPAWKVEVLRPSLESIMESPQVLEMDR